MPANLTSGVLETLWEGRFVQVPVFYWSFNFLVLEMGQFERMLLVHVKMFVLGLSLFSSDCFAQFLAHAHWRVDNCDPGKLGILFVDLLRSV